MPNVKKRKPLDPKLPGKYGRMTEAELSAESDRYDEPGVAMAEADATRQTPHPRHPRKKSGQPRKPAGTTVERVMISVEPALLRAADAFVDEIGETRAGWIQKLMIDALAAGHRGIASTRTAKSSAPDRR